MKELTYAEIRRRIAAIENDPAAASATIFGRTADRELRSEVEGRIGAEYSDHDWREARAGLLGFFALLAEWKDQDERAET